MARAAAPRRVLSLPARALVSLLVAATVAAGIWIAGGLITNDFMTSVVLTAVWMGAAGLASLLVALRSRQLRVPVVAGYAVVAVVAAVWLGRAELFDRTVHSNVIKPDALPSNPPPRSSSAGRNLLLAQGKLRSIEHPSQGVARLIRTREGSQVLTLTRFSTSNGPDLRVYLAAGRVADSADVHDFADLGALQGNKGDQQYRLRGRGLRRRYRTVVIWCRAFSVAFAAAPLADR